MEEKIIKKSEAIRDSRIKLGVKQSEVAFYLYGHYNNGNINAYENGRKIPNQKTFDRIMEAIKALAQRKIESLSELV